MKRVCVLGGSSGMGLATAKLMAKHGYEVVIASRSKEKLASAQKEIGKAESYTLDLTNEDEIAEFFKKIGQLDHLVVTGTLFHMSSFIEGKTQDARDYFDSKFWGQYSSAKHAAPILSKDGSITFFSGAANYKPIVGFSAGCAINAAIEGLGRALALELAPIRVNTISPGVINSPLWNAIPKEDREGLFEHVENTFPLKKVGSPEAIAEAVRFLIECDYATGSVIQVDGGYPLV